MSAEARMLRKSGEIFCVVFICSLIQIDGQTHRLNSFIDITAQRESEVRICQALEATSDGLWNWNIATGDVCFSPQRARLLGYEPKEVPGHVGFFYSVLHPVRSQARRPSAARCVRLRLWHDRGRRFPDFRSISTTKRVGGAGLGLAGVQRIVLSHHGAPPTRRRRNFRTVFPCPAHDHSLSVSLINILYFGRGERILLVEDERIAIETMKGLLERLGYHVADLLSTNDALARFQAAPDGFDAAITDRV